MSRDATQWAWTLPITSQCDLLVLLSLANYANHENKSWPGHARVASEARCSVSSVQRSLKALTKAGYITIKSGALKNGRRTTNLYTLNLPKVRSVKMTDTPSQNDRARSVKMTEEPYQTNLKVFEPIDLLPEQDTAREETAPRLSNRNSFLKGMREGVDPDALARAEGLGCPVDRFEPAALRPSVKNPTAYFVRSCVKWLGDEVPTARREVLEAGFRNAKGYSSLLHILTLQQIVR